MMSADRTHIELPNEVWLLILDKIKADARMSKQPLQLHVVFLSSVSKQISALCETFKRTNQDEQWPTPTDFTRYFAENGYLSCLAYAHENVCQWNRQTCFNAALNGHLACLKYLHEHGCPWDEETCSYAAFNGQIECLKYAHESGCKWNEWTCTNAALNGHLECLKYAHEKGCPWDEEACADASKNGRADCLAYIHERGCPCGHC